MAFNLEDKIRWEELAPSLQAFLKKLQKMIEDEIARAKSAEKKLSDRIDKIWGSDGEKSSHDITEIWKKIKKLEGDLGKVGGKIDGVVDTIAKNLDITSFQAIRILFAYIFCINLIVCYACDELIFVLHFWMINLDN